MNADCRSIKIPHRRGIDLQALAGAGHFSADVQGPLLTDMRRSGHRLRPMLEAARSRSRIR